MDVKIKRIFGFIPVPVFYVENIGSGDFPAGRSYGPWVQIKNEYKTDTGLLDHELVHCKQFWALLIFHPLLYTVSKRYKYWAELTAYRVQLKSAINDADRIRLIEKFSWFICNRYNLNLDQEKVKKDLAK